MTERFFALYDTLIDNIRLDERVERSFAGDFWSVAETEQSSGIAMTTPGDSIAPLYPGGLTGLSLKEAAGAAKSWNLTESGFGMAAVNAYYNRVEALERLRAAEPFENFCTEGLDLRGKTVGVIGHLRMPPELLQEAGKVCIIERAPQPGDYPDAASDLILPDCDVVLITGSTLVNKTLPHLLELCRNAYTILTGPSVPLCPALLEHGIDRLAGLVITDRAGLREHAGSSRSGPPYGFGETFLLKRR